MGKILFWVAIAFIVLFALRLANFAAAKKRDARKQDTPSKPLPKAEPTVRCVQCGTFLPKTDALPAPDGYRCGQGGCARRN